MNSAIELLFFFAIGYDNANFWPIFEIQSSSFCAKLYVSKDRIDR